MAFGGGTEAEIFNNFIIRMRDDLQAKGIVSRLEFAGSRYKGTQVSESDYDVMFVKRDTSITAQASQQYDKHYLLSKSGVPVNRDDWRGRFQEEIPKSLRAIGAFPSGAAQYAQIKKAYGPTVVVICRLPGCREFEMDMVYAIEVDSGYIYVAKAPNGAPGNLWYKTKVLDEKDKMRTIDKGNAVGRWAVRRLKKLKEIEPGLQPLNSYSFEQALMYVKDLKPDEMFWRENNMVAILQAILSFMVSALRAGSLWSYLDQSNNTIGGLTDIQMDQIANRFEYLAKNPQKIIDRTNDC